MASFRTVSCKTFFLYQKVRAAEAKVSFPSRHDWDSYFRDAKNMNEMKPGERPDTIHIKDLPTRWFSSKQTEREESELTPSEEIVRQVFQTFGQIRCIDIPMLDPYRKEVRSYKYQINMFRYFVIEDSHVFSHQPGMF